MTAPVTLERGGRFDTDFEAGCVVWSPPDDDGEFLAYDSDNVLCGFNVVMVVGHPDHVPPTVTAAS